MGHVHKRLVSNVAKSITSVSTAHLKRFPPKEALFVKREVPKEPFDPETWAALQPPPPSALSAFAHRIGLAEILSSTERIQQICTHSSFALLHSQRYPHEHTPETNSHLAAIGNALMGLFATEYIYASYPYLPTRVLTAAVTAYVGPLSCASVANEMGAAPLLRWHRTPKTPTRPTVLHTEALSSVPRALTALISQRRSLVAAREFVHSHFMSREVDIRGMIKFRDPKKALLEMVSKFGRERPKSRLLKETGRFSNSPIYVVGVYSGADKLGDGFGNSLKMAEFRASEDALHRVYLTQTPRTLLQLPTSTFPAGYNVFRAHPKLEGHYTAPDLVIPEIMYASSGKSSAIVPRTPSLE